MNYYAVAKGRIPGIYFDWLSAANQTDGYSSPIVKSFLSYHDALLYLLNYEHQQNIELARQNEPLDAIIETNGLQLPTERYANKLVVAYRITPVGTRQAEPIQEVTHIDLNNFTTETHAAEFYATIAALETAIKHDFKHVKIIYTYKGIKNQLNPDWSPISNIAKECQANMLALAQQININFEENLKLNQVLIKELTTYKKDQL